MMYVVASAVVVIGSAIIGAVMAVKAAQKYMRWD